MPDPLVFTRKSIRELDRLAVEEFGVPSLVLMENASQHVAAATMAHLGKKRDRGVVICCGRGNNGGDGLAVARHLHNAGVPVALVLVAETWEFAGDPAVQANIALRMALPMQVAHAGGVRDAFEIAWKTLGRPAAIIDALLGTGVEKMVQPGSIVAHLIEAINDTRAKRACKVIAVDLPSGLDCDTGRPLVRRPDGTTTAVRADLTVTFVGLKRGFAEDAAKPYLGEVLITDIGAPIELAQRLGRPMNEKGKSSATGTHERPEPRGTSARGRLSSGKRPVKPD